MKKTRIKLVVTGAAGQIGYALLFRIASGQMFGLNTEIDLNLLELPLSLPILHGVAMELEDCAFPLLRTVVCTSDLKTAMSDINWAILVGSSPRKAGTERSELLRINGSIFSQQGKAINDYAASDARILVVGNPCNTNCLIAMHHAPERSPRNFYAMTLLDQYRATAQLAKKAGVSTHDIEHMTVWGNHSSTQYPDFYHATVSGKSVLDVIKDKTWLQETFITTVQERGAAIIKARGASSAASAANAIVNSIHYLSHDTPAEKEFSLALCSSGEYDVDPGLIFSYPCQINQGELRIILGHQHNTFAKKKLQATLAELRAEHQAVKELGLI